ncbi:Fructosamine kinase-domain-containing protein [Xylariaceae sp. FL0662B]|nr:Fructosamine kinase-domain-containing protein [Xylariaceae sp. FL0662B]
MADIEEVDVPIDAIQVIDPEVISKLPPGTKVLSITAHGASFWTRTARLDAERDRVPVKYFLKTSFGDRGRAMMPSELYCMTQIHAVKPDLVPQPIAWGTYRSIPDVHFFLCAFRPMRGTIPDIAALPAAMAALHRAGTSPSGQFGFDVATFHGNTAVDHGWSDTWEAYFARTTRALFALERAARGPSEEIESRLKRPFFDKVVPRLLRPLETGGRAIRPALVHGDLWHGNADVDAETGTPVIFDAASFYAHNEYELGVWRQPWNKIPTAYRARYHEHFAKSPPEEDFDDRNALYATRVNLLDSILYKQDSSYRDMLISSMRMLVAKYPGGFEEWEASREHPR